MSPRLSVERRLDQNAGPPQDRYPIPACHDRRSFLRAVGRAGLAAASVLRSGAVLLVPGAALLQSARAEGEGRQPLIQPPEIRSGNRVLSPTTTADHCRWQRADYPVPGF